MLSSHVLSLDTLGIVMCSIFMSTSLRSVLDGRCSPSCLSELRDSSSDLIIFFLSGVSMECRYYFYYYYFLFPWSEVFLYWSTFILLVHQISLPAVHNSSIVAFSAARDSERLFISSSRCLSANIMAYSHIHVYLRASEDILICRNICI